MEQPKDSYGKLRIPIAIGSGMTNPPVDVIPQFAKLMKESLVI